MGGGTMRAVAKAAALGVYRAPGLFSGQAAASAARRSPLNISAAVPPSTEGVPAVFPAAVADRRTAGRREKKRKLGSGQGDYEKEVFEPQRVYFSGAVATSGGQALTFVPTVPKHVAQTFSLLIESPEVQVVVASLASDKNIWDAVIKNPKVMEFYTNQQYVNEDPVASDDTNERCESSTKARASPSGFAGFWQNVKVHMTYTMTKVEELVQNTKVKVEEMFTTTKVKVEKMVSNISSFFESFFGTSTETSGGGGDYATAGFLALAITVIMVILVKRG